MREAFARIIDPEAFAGERLAGIDAMRRELALQKADQILKLEFSFEELPADVQSDVGRVLELVEDAGLRPPLDPIIATDGRPVFTSLVKPMEDGKLLVCVLLEDEAPADDERGRWAIEMMEGDEARRLAAEIEVAAAGGGRA